MRGEYLRQGACRRTLGLTVCVPRGTTHSPGQGSCHVKTAVKKLVGSTGSPWGRRVRGVRGGVCGGWEVGALEDPDFIGGHSIGR